MSWYDERSKAVDRFESLVNKSRSRNPPPRSPNQHLNALVDDIIQNLNLASPPDESMITENFGATERFSRRKGKPPTDELTDRKNRLIAGMISQFRTLVQLASTAPSDGATREMAAAHGLRLEAETQTLIRTAEDILVLTRELKEMWLFGALRKLGEGEEEGSMDDDSEKVLGMVQELLKAAREKDSAESRVEETIASS